MRALLLALAWAAPGVAQDRCILACDRETASAEAAERLAAYLSRPRPEGARVAGLLEGGFQDAFIQVRLEVTDVDLPRLLHDLAVGPDDLAPRRGESFGPAGLEWWSVEAYDGLLVGQGRLDGFAWTLVGVMPHDEGATVYLWAFQT